MDDVELEVPVVEELEEVVDAVDVEV